ADAVSIVQMRDIDVVLALVSLDDPVSGKAYGATVRMVNDDDLPDPEQMLRDGDGPKRIDGTAAGDDDRKNGRRRCHTISGAVQNNVSRKRLVAKQFGDSVRYLGRPRIVAVDHEGFERHGSGKGLACLRLVK